ncbi:hypothetical protein UWK_02237 [Desulfocapsa sulfexigens DSM 10523]|uniref:DUF4393 domain-containing protein n=1 Tax=Desulfocapsa sulfexigens (strain DSM 10523 / SB164P1) TaxID=1167006 RepID=M1P5K6_DESSD|nr:DUF4393 domain-containing protein [Desulfocapsa sulfexigens]AGF78778.1 hypothetical protein UWK_02237 [Desulfocapsa sulfexigens DSM 10523]
MEEKVIKSLIPKIYDDVVHGAAKEFGNTLTEAIKVTLRPVSGLISTVDKTFDWVESAIEQKFKNERKDPSTIVSPEPEMAIRVIQGLQSTINAEDPLPRTMFVNLLAGNMDQEKIDTTHPAFAEVLKNLVSDECRIFSVIASSPYNIIEAHIFASLYMKVESGFQFSKDSFPLQVKAGIKNNSRMWLYISNLERLGLVKTKKESLFPHEDCGSKYSYGVMGKLWSEFEKYKKEKRKDERCPQTLDSSYFWSVKLTTFGNDFAVATGANWAYSGESNKFNIQKWAIN